MALKLVPPLPSRGDIYLVSRFYLSCRFGGKQGRLVLDQLRTVDRERLKKRLGTIGPATLAGALAVLGEMFEQ